MRLICPNCGAQYEVADDVIPEAGRDVQCSNCGHTWLEKPGASVAAEAAMEAPAADPIPEPVEEPIADTPPDAAPVPEPEVEAEPAQDTAPDVPSEPEPQDEPEPEPEEAPAPELKPRELAPDVASILQEEAAFEQAAREAQADPIETQPDLGLQEDADQDRRSREARDRLARLRGEPEAAIATMMAQEAAAPRRELLPDIEEINSTLRPDAAPGEAEIEEELQEKNRSGFRRGFTIMVLLALIAIALYLFAPQIGAAVPALDGILTSYVEWVNGLRIWLDTQVQGFIASADAPTDG